MFQALCESRVSIFYQNGGTCVSLASTAPQNNKLFVGENKKYDGVGGHLFAIAVEDSLVKGGNGTIEAIKLLEKYNYETR